MSQIPLTTQVTLNEYQSSISGMVDAQLAGKSQAVAGIGSWVGGLTGYNLGKWQQQAGGRMSWVSIGHSIAKGNNAVPAYTKGFIPLIRNWMQALYGDGGQGLYHLGRTEWTASAGWSSTAFGPHGITKFVVDNAVPDYTLNAVVGDSMDIFYLDVPSAGAITYIVDGGASQTVAVAGAGDTASKKVTVSLGSLGTHTIAIHGPSTGKLYLMGASVYKGSGGAVVHDWALSGATTASVGSSTTKLDVLPFLAPSLVTIMCMINDHYTQVPLATFTTQLNTIIDAAQATGADVLLLLEPDIQETFAITQRQYEDTAKAIAVAQGIPWASFSDLWGDYSLNAARMGDTVHPNNLGHAEMAQPLIRLLKAA